MCIISVVMGSFHVDNTTRIETLSMVRVVRVLSMRLPS